MILFSTRNCGYKLEYVDYVAFYVGVSSGEILTHVKEHQSCTNKSSGNPVEPKRLQIRSTIKVEGIFNNHQIDTKNIKIIQKAFTTTKKGE
ncbi:unnamed protein product [Schistosoma margrebowiei]|uniref:Uncharacterized protein n=1 Tax=Schistosoma margrebowiei TaxID=48269 RepID=A0A183N9G5_9TREM|nr:unnamed protein product [Schistosoma margrebowiei]